MHFATTILIAFCLMTEFILFSTSVLYMVYLKLNYVQNCQLSDSSQMAYHIYIPPCIAYTHILRSSFLPFFCPSPINLQMLTMPRGIYFQWVEFLFLFPISSSSLWGSFLLQRFSYFTLRGKWMPSNTLLLPKNYL